MAQPAQSPPAEKTGFAVLALIVCAMFWGSNVVVGRAVHAEIPPVALAFWRNIVAVTVLLPFTLPNVIAQWGLIRKSWRVILAAGVIGTALFNSTLYLALQTTTAINAALVMSLTPVAVPAMAFLLLRDRLTTWQAAGIAASLAGVVVILGRGDPAVLAGLAFVPGDFLMIGATLCWSFYVVVVKFRPPDLGPFTFLTAVLACVGPAILPFYIWETTTVRPMPLTWEAAAAAGYLGIFPTMVALILFNRAVEVLGPNRSGQYQHLVPVFASIFAIVFLGERLALFHIVGAALIAAGLYLATVRRPAR